MAQTRPTINHPGDGSRFPVVQSNPRKDMYISGKTPDNISALYRKKQRQPGSIVKQPYMDAILPSIQNPRGTPGITSLMGSGKHKVKRGAHAGQVRNPYSYNYGTASKRLAARNELNISAKSAKPIKAIGSLTKNTISKSYTPMYQPVGNKKGF